MTPGRMTQEEIRDLARQHVADRLYRTEGVERPTAIVLAGQSGSGKTTVSAELKEGLNTKGGYINIDADEMRPHLPYFPELDPKTRDVADITQIDAGKAAQAVREEAVRARRNIVVDGTLRDSDGALKLAKDLHEAGYRVELHAMAVNEQISYARATARYEFDKQDGYFARYVPKEWHDRSAQGMAESVRRLEYQGAVDRITLYDRIGNTLSDQAPIKGETTSAKYLEAHREKLTDFERVDLAETWDRVLESMDRRGAPASERGEAQVAAERAHYGLRGSETASVSYDDRNPGERTSSTEKAETYGLRLEQAFRDVELHKTRDLPELAKAFSASAAARRYAEANPQIATGKFEAAMKDRIAGDLANGRPLPGLQVRDGSFQATDRAALAEQIEHDF